MKERKPSVSAYFPAFLDVHGRRCVVIGGGGVALRKAIALLEAGARVKIISPNVHPDLVRLEKEKVIRVIRRNYEPGDLDRPFVVVAATDDRKINRKVAHEAKNVRALVNVVDDPNPSDFIVPAVLRRGDLTVAISTGGRSPALSRKLRERLERTFGEGYAPLVALVEEVRSSLKRKGIAVGAETWQEALDVDRILEFLRSGKRKKAKDFLASRLTRGKT